MMALKNCWNPFSPVILPCFLLVEIQRFHHSSQHKSKTHSPAMLISDSALRYYWLDKQNGYDSSNTITTFVCLFGGVLVEKGEWTICWLLSWLNHECCDIFCSDGLFSLIVVTTEYDFNTLSEYLIRLRFYVSDSVWCVMVVVLIVVMVDSWMLWYLLFWLFVFFDCCYYRLRF